MTMRVILASNSPRRKQLLSTILDDFMVIPSKCDEISDITEAKQLVMQLSKDKAQDVLLTHSNDLVIGCDTVVELDGVIFGKPSNYQQAYDMLKSLSGRTHVVYTGVTIATSTSTTQFAEQSFVTFKNLSVGQIKDYIATGSPYDKAGAYGIQDDSVVESYEGSYSNIIGLPIERLTVELARILSDRIKKYQGESKCQNT